MYPPPATTAEYLAVSYHNAARAAHNAGNLTWNAEIAAFAQTWCNYMAEKDEWGHSPWNGAQTGDIPLRESLM